MNVQLSPEIAEKVRAIAAQEHHTIEETVRMLTEEAVNAREFPEITFVEGATGRRARLRRGPDVREVLEPYVLAGKNWEALKETYPFLDETLLREAVRYYEAYPREIDARIALNQRA
jgi:uncharacterized protein (DUF433 family)